ncbi:maleylpyruvate isomerase family mycothiol-dependent enzyme [Kineococcus gynurae]|uniref:Maleylpyruvate isomerase family mycothiol-dependent enzyme n=1 Tax=Kineococcus gynurae TaxID=452979 RepID=A0ABV5LWK1_9ACTN
MDLFAEIAAERRALADHLADLGPEGQRTPSLCAGWTVHHVVAHLVMPMEVSLPRVVLTMLRTVGDYDRANDRITRRLARRPFAELLGVLRDRADSRFTPPGQGPDAPLLDVVVHGLDACRPLGRSRDVPPARLRRVLDHAAGAPKGLAPKGALAGLRFEADDLDWAHGAGPGVRGPAQALLPALTGRAGSLDDLTGDGVPLLRRRLARS